MLLRKLWKQSPALTATCVLMLAALLANIIGMVVDPTVITGVPAWLKPAKFAISTALFSATMAWFYGYLPVTKSLRRTGDILAAALIIEVGIIDLQAFRGTSSHFNTGTTLDGVLFGIMGIAILILWVAIVIVCIALFRRRFADQTLGWALRLGMLLTVIGTSAGALMLRTTPEQAREHRLHQNVTLNGGHTVGAPDGGAGLPGVGWSTQHGDLRIPHFVGLHALQVIPCLAWLVRRRRRATALVLIAAGSYLGLFAILAWQALRGESIAQPGSLTLAATGLWFAATAIAAALTQRPSFERAHAAAGAIS